MELINNHNQISIRRQCELLEISRSSFYYEPKKESEDNLLYMKLMDEYYFKHPTAGVLSMEDFLEDLGYNVNPKRVRRLLRQMGLEAIYPKRNLSKLGQAQYIYPYLLRNLKVERVNQVWAIDITYIPMKKGFMYLTAIIDVYSRFIVGWGVSNSLTAEASYNVLKQAIQDYGCPEIINSDQGSQFTCEGWINLLKESKIRISMDGKGRAIDNVFIERFWRTIKYDYIYLNPASDGIELFQGIKEFTTFYNYQKKHQGLERRKPSEVFFKEAA